jgi:UDP-N-acetylmuramoyl-tripeptide--D-alanyl-D-alanine ligase
MNLDTISPSLSELADLLSAAHRHRDQLRDVKVVAVTGSCGKTTTKDLAAAILATRYKGSKNDDTRNCGPDLVATVLAARPDHDFLVQELGAWGPDTLDEGISLVRPNIGVVTNLRNDHYSSFRGPRGAQAEKGKVVARLPPNGAAVLNWDDPLVRELSSWTAAHTLSFGRSPDAALRAWDVTASWPERLTFKVSYGNKTAQVHSRLVGEHLLGSALAALCVAILFGMALDEAVAALASAGPTFRRMSPVAHPDGVTFIRDDWKAPLDSLPEVLSFMRTAAAPRKIAVFGRISDIPGRSRQGYERVAFEALAVLDAVIFVGKRATELWGEHQGTGESARAEICRRVAPPALGSTGCVMADEQLGKMFVFSSVHGANAFLQDILAPGDLVLLKGSGPADHLERLLLTRERRVECWLPECGRVYPCDMCDRVHGPDSDEPGVARLA